jgi:hypothetical protein
VQNSNQSVQFPCICPTDVVFRLDAHQSATSVRTMRTFRPNAHQCLEASNSSSLHLSGCNGISSGRSSEFEKIPMFQWIRPDDMLYRPDAIQCLTSIRVFATRHSYGKTADHSYVWSRPDDVLHKASRAYKVQPSGRQSSWSGWSSIRYGNCVHLINRPDAQVCRLDARARDSDSD